MKKSRKGGLWLLAVVLTVVGIESCTTDQLPEPMEAECGGETFTYTTDIRPIVDASCAYSGCHLDSSPGRFDTYNGLLPYLEDNRLRQRVLIQRADPNEGMPPDYAAADRPRDLTSEQLEIIECWLDAGFPE